MMIDRVFWLNQKKYELGDSVDSHGGNSTVVVPVPGHLDVALLAPGSAPGVLHDPVVLASLRAVANNGHTVVQPGLMSRKVS